MSAVIEPGATRAATMHCRGRAVARGRVRRTWATCRSTPSWRRCAAWPRCCRRACTRSTCARTAIASSSPSARSRCAGRPTCCRPRARRRVVDEAMAQHPDSYCIGDGDLVPAPARYLRLPERAARTRRRDADARRRRAGRDRLHLRQHRPPAGESEDLGQLPPQHRAEPRRAGRPVARRRRAHRRHRAAAAHVRHGDVGAAAAARPGRACMRRGRSSPKTSRSALRMRAHRASW